MLMSVLVKLIHGVVSLVVVPCRSDFNCDFGSVEVRLASSNDLRVGVSLKRR